MIKCTVFFIKENNNEKFRLQNMIKLFDEDFKIFSDKESSFFYFFKGESFYFFSELGHAVTFGDEHKFLQNTLKGYRLVDFPEEFSVNFGDKFLIKNDVITIPKMKSSFLHSASFAISQSFKLSTITERIQNRLDEASVFPRSLALNGDINLSKKELAILRGKLFLDWSDANLSFELLDTPNYFWENPEHTGVYQEMRNYLEIDQRLEVLNKKVDVVNQILTMLSEEQKHRDSSLLEIIIIILIFIEIIMLFYFEYFK